LSTYS